MNALSGLRRLQAASLFTAVLGAATPAIAADAYDGPWSVQIVAENGACSDRYTIPLQVEGGRVRYSGKFEAEATGRIGANGALNISFSHEDDVVRAKGKLDGEKGLGSWTSPSKRCDGTWTARKG